MIPIPIYRDHTGQWREQNPYVTCRGNTHSVSCVCGEWALFEQSITYHEFPNAPETKQGEVVMAYLQWQLEDVFGIWENISEESYKKYITANDIQVSKCYNLRQIWVAVTDSAKEEEAKINNMEQSKYAITLTVEQIEREVEQFLDDGTITIAFTGRNGNMKWIPRSGAEVTIADVNTPDGEEMTLKFFIGHFMAEKFITECDKYLSETSAPKVEASAENALEETIRGINPNWDYGKDLKECFQQFWLFFDPSPGLNIMLKAMEQYATLKTSSLQYLLEDKEKEVAELKARSENFRECLNKIGELATKNKSISIHQIRDICTPILNPNTTQKE